MPKISGGYYIKARKIQESTIHKKPPYVREIWDWLLMNANHSDKKYNGYTVKRGQLFRTYKDIREGLSWFVGYRKEMYNENHTKKAMKALREAGMIASTKELGGVLITILNYDRYQNPKNYERTNERTNESTTIEPMENQGGPDNNKNVKNVNNEKNIKDFSDSDESKIKKTEQEFYITKRNRKLSGKRLETFETFWECFNYKSGKADAADAWLDIPILTNNLVEGICKAAKAEAGSRQDVLHSGNVPKMAQGWISSKRWEDEQILTNQSKTKNEIQHDKFTGDNYYGKSSTEGKDNPVF
jgi:hypothetical protein